MSDIKEPKKDKVCLICGRKYDVVLEKNGYIFYRHQGMKREHEFSQKVLYSGVVREQ